MKVQEHTRDSYGRGIDLHPLEVGCVDVLPRDDRRVGGGCAAWRPRPDLVGLDAGGCTTTHRDELPCVTTNSDCYSMPSASLPGQGIRRGLQQWGHSLLASHSDCEIVKVVSSSSPCWNAQQHEGLRSPCRTTPLELWGTTFAKDCRLVRSEEEGRAWAAARLDASVALYAVAFWPCRCASAVTLPRDAPYAPCTHMEISQGRMELIFGQGHCRSLAWHSHWGRY